MTSITTTVRNLRELVEPVIPLAANDYGLPVLTAVLIESRGQWLTASATDRFRLGIKRIPAPDGDPLPEFRALVSVRALKSMLSTFKARRGEDPEITLTVDRDLITVEATGGLIDDVAGQRATYHLTEGEYPNLDPLIRKALDAEPAPMTAHFNWKFLSQFQAATGGWNSTLEVRSGGPLNPLLVIGEDFVGCLMPRRIEGGWASADGWSDLLRFDNGKEKVA